jgi:hypothetical protein
LLVATGAPARPDTTAAQTGDVVTYTGASWVNLGAVKGDTGDTGAAGADGTIYKYQILESDQTSTSATPNFDLFTVTLPAGTYKIDAMLQHVSATSTNGINIGFGGTGTYTIVGNLIGQISAAGANLVKPVSTGETTFMTSTAGVADVVSASLTALINVTVAGTFILQLGSETSGALTVKAGSWATVTELVAA